ncbi:MAG: RagB/SusD family nutrient uptake outer membrane protein [Prolixibacteraceae bacterium]
MKNNFIERYLIAFLLVALTVSCEKDFLDTRIDTQMTDVNVESDYHVLFQFANAPYSQLYRVANGFSAIDNNLFAVCSDEAVQTSTGYRQSTTFTKGLMTPYNNPDDLYSVCYEGIRAANYFLENSEDYKERLSRNRDTISDNGKQYQLDVADLGFYRAEAHVLRAFYYYELIKRYGDVPLVETTLSINDNTDIARSNVADIVHFIEKEIDDHLFDLQENWLKYDKNKQGRIDKAVALSIKHRTLMLFASPLYNTEGDINRWKKAAAAANEIFKLNAYSLHKKYGELFTSDQSVKSAETIWAIRLGENNSLEWKNYPINSPGGNNEITPTDNLVSAYEKLTDFDEANPYLNRDPRLGYTIASNGSMWTGREIQIYEGGTDDYTKPNVSRTGYYLKKFLNNNLDLVNDASKQRSWIVFRYGELLLSYAEAMNEAFGPDNNNGYAYTAREAVNMVRARPDVAMAEVNATGQNEMRDKIKHERRIELAFEGYRYWDLIRWKDAEEALNATLLGVVATVSGDAKVNYETIAVENRVFSAPKMYLYPISQFEIVKSNGVLIQNPGW